VAMFVLVYISLRHATANAPWSVKVCHINYVVSRIVSSSYQLADYAISYCVLAHKQHRAVNLQCLHHFLYNFLL
jgi:hypothetical protein